MDHRSLVFDGELGPGSDEGIAAVEREVDSRCTLDVEHERDLSSRRSGPRCTGRVEAMDIAQGLQDDPGRTGRHGVHNRLVGVGLAQEVGQLRPGRRDRAVFVVHVVRSEACGVRT